MRRLVRFATPAKRIAAQLVCKSPLYFQQVTNCFSAKSFSLICIQTAPGCGRVLVGLAKRALFVGVTPNLPAPVVVPSYVQSFHRFCTRSPIGALPPSRIHCCFDQEVPF